MGKELTKVRFTNLNKIIFPPKKIEKKQLIEYYIKIAQKIIPILENRTIVLNHFPNGINKKGFYKKNIPKGTPAWIKTIKIDKNPEECTTQQIAQSKLDPYFSKRDFNKTKEPIGNKKTEKGSIFVVQEHHSRRLHFDLRLEKNGALKSWAVPKGIPLEKNKKRLAVEVEDHPIDYAKFEGTIPKGEYGAGTVEIWDKGVFETKNWENDLIEFFPKGKKMIGKYILVRLKKDKGKNWLLFKGRD
jgi:DNA ligase D-like protein (predicted 3'-phosphoesterase)